MWITGLQVENFKKIKVFALEPKGNVIKISGANASGKTSALDAIQLAIAGTRGGPSAPVRRGAGRGAVRINFGEFIVNRIWTEGGDSKGEMWIEAKDGMQYPSPQKVLDGFMGKLSFDPLAFIRMEPKAQSVELRKLLDLDEALDELKAKEQVDYNVRRDRTKYLDQLKAQRLALEYPAGLPNKKRDIDAMMKELASVADFNLQIEREKTRRELERQRIENTKAAYTDRSDEIDRLRAKIQELQALNGQDLKDINEYAAALKKQKPLAEPKDALALTENIAAARAVNVAIDRKADADAKDKEIERTEQEVQKLSDNINGYRKKQESTIMQAKYPVPGLGFSEEGVTYNGLPFEQASNAEQIEVSVAMGMAGNPKLRVMRIKDGSLLDDESMAMIEKMADQNEFQVWVEVVDTSGKVGVYLVDGEIAAVDGAEPPPFKLAAPLGPPRKKAAKKERGTE